MEEQNETLPALSDAVKNPGAVLLVLLNQKIHLALFLCESDDHLLRIVGNN